MNFSFSHSIFHKGEDKIINTEDKIRNYVIKPVF